MLALHALLARRLVQSHFDVVQGFLQILSDQFEKLIAAQFKARDSPEARVTTFKSIKCF
jgi:hypothetical protein